MIKFLLDSGDPDEYREISGLAEKNGYEIWGGTTNPSLIAKKLTGTKVTSTQQAFELQKQIVLEILNIVPGAVSAEVYADANTKAEEMVTQGLEIARWHERVVVKLPTTLEGFKARTELRRGNIATNNTLVFSQEQIFAICLHEKIMQESLSLKEVPLFISPFVGRLDDIGENGMGVIENGMKIKQVLNSPCWMLEASVRRPEHIKRALELNAESITAPAKTFAEWFNLGPQQAQLDSTAYTKDLKQVEYWQPANELLGIKTVEEFMDACQKGLLNINHELTDKGIVRFANDWQAIIQKEETQTPKQDDTPILTT